MTPEEIIEQYKQDYGVRIFLEDTIVSVMQIYADQVAEEKDKEIAFQRTQNEYKRNHIDMLLQELEIKDYQIGGIIKSMGKLIAEKTNEIAALKEENEWWQKQNWDLRINQ